MESEDEDSRVTRARPLPEPGSRSSRIYLRRTEGLALPKAIEAQGTYITVFEPPGGSKDVLRLTEFTRPAVLAHLQPGRTDDEHEKILEAALRLAKEETPRGGYRSGVSRGPGHGSFLVALYCGGWGVVRGGNALANLRVPSRGKLAARSRVCPLRHLARPSGSRQIGCVACRAHPGTCSAEH